MPDSCTAGNPWGLLARISQVAAECLRGQNLHEPGSVASPPGTASYIGYSAALAMVRVRKLRTRWKVRKLASWKSCAPPRPSS